LTATGGQLFDQLAWKERDALNFRDQSLAAGAALLTINEAHAIETAAFPGIHEDPFDRLIIAQARIEGMTAVSSDARWSEYSIALRRA
jgi:PIN domain nuclease of toxin-antitoxin system